MIKHGADLRGIQPEMVLAYFITAHIFWSQHGAECVITEGSGAHHMNGSLHYTGRALDIRIRHIPTNEWNALKLDVKGALGPQYDVVLELEPPHLHLEFQPKDVITESPTAPI